jgi:hypothetical protein
MNTKDILATLMIIDKNLSIIKLNKLKRSSNLRKALSQLKASLVLSKQAANEEISILRKIEENEINMALTIIVERLKKDDNYLFDSICKIHNYQTEDEKVSFETKWQNGVGFSSYDAGILSSFANQINAWKAIKNKRYSKPLSQAQILIAKKRMPKYANQLRLIMLNQQSKNREV